MGSTIIPEIRIHTGTMDQNNRRTIISILSAV